MTDLMQRAGTVYSRRRRPSHRRWALTAALAAVLTAAALGLWWRPGARDAHLCPDSTARSSWRADVGAAADIGIRHGLRVGVAVVDTLTGGCVVAGEVDGLFATASVIKVLIAARLLSSGQMDADTARLAYRMIISSDDDAANVLWWRSGADSLEPWVAEHYGLPHLGSPNAIAGRWGNTHVRPAELARLYAALKADPAVWPWLGDAMHHMRPTAKDGTDQVFGIAATDKDAAVKQGWANGSADDPDDAVVNSTGFLGSDRYVVIILTEGNHNNDGDDARGFNGDQAAIVTEMVGALGRP
jgi:Beta-lactamase enzyme family